MTEQLRGHPFPSSKQLKLKLSFDQGVTLKAQHLTKSSRVRRYLFGSRKRKIVAIAGTSVFAISSAAFAYFALNTGNGNFAVASPATFTVTVGAATGGPIAPGVGTASMPLTVTNSTTHSESLTALNFAMTTDSSGGVFDVNSGTYVDACKAIWFSAGGGTGGVTLPDALAAGASLSGAAAVEVTMPANTTTDQGACEGLQPQVTVTVS